MPHSDERESVREDPDREVTEDDGGSGKDEHDRKGKPGKRKLA